MSVLGSPGDGQHEFRGTPRRPEANPETKKSKQSQKEMKDKLDKRGIEPRTASMLADAKEELYH